MFDANNWFNNGYQAQNCVGVSHLNCAYALPKDSKFDFGGSLAGPIRIPNLYNGRNRSFFFFAWEQYKLQLGGNTQSTVPTTTGGTTGQGEQAGDFSGILGGPTGVTNPCTGLPVLQNQIFDPATSNTVVSATNPSGIPCRYPFPGNIGALMPGDENILYYQVRAHTLAAQESFRTLFKIDPDSAMVHRARAEIFSESQQPDKAIVEYQAAIKKSPSNVELYEALGNEEQKVSHVAEAQSAYQSELTLAPGSAIALFNLGKIEVETGDAQQGVALLQRAMEAHASLAPTCFYLGLGFSKLGKNEEAVGWLERVLTNAPSDSIRQRDYFELVRVYQRLNRREDSERALAELKKLKAQAAPPAEGKP